MRFTRFERKILTAIVAVAFMPLIASLVLGRIALQNTYDVGVNAGLYEQLEAGLEIYQRHFRSLRQDAERTADAVAYRQSLGAAIASGEANRVEAEVQAILERYDNVAAVEVMLENGETWLRIARDEPIDETRVRTLELERGPDGGRRIAVTVTTEAKPFSDYQRAGEVVEVYRRLQESADYLSGTYLFVYIGFLLAVIVAALGVGIVLSRRVTRRVVDLAQATARVGAGDLTVQVPTSGRDEIEELTGAFNSMVQDLRESRVRIDYLQRISAWQDFARRLAHEIKNPLTPIQLAAQEMEQSYKGDDPRHRRALEDARSIIEEEVATLRRLVGEFSSFAKLPEAELGPADLQDFIADLDRSVAVVGEEGDRTSAPPVEVKFEVGESLPVRIDAMMLKRCVDNLVRNGVQAIRGAGRSGRVRVLGLRQDDEAWIEVHDDGPGIPAEDRARVFDPYYTTKVEGTGLGLAIVKKVVLEHSGEIECDASPDGGACFRVRLPVYQSE
ncbi:MAG: ATP-binding protein [Myxococcota bacterium]